MLAAEAETVCQVIAMVQAKGKLRWRDQYLYLEIDISNPSNTNLAGSQYTSNPTRSLSWSNNKFLEHKVSNVTVFRPNDLIAETRIDAVTPPFPCSARLRWFGAEAVLAMLSSSLLASTIHH